MADEKSKAEYLAELDALLRAHLSDAQRQEFVDLLRRMDPATTADNLADALVAAMGDGGWC